MVTYVCHWQSMDMAAGSSSIRSPGGLPRRVRGARTTTTTKKTASWSMILRDQLAYEEMIRSLFVAGLLIVSAYLRLPSLCHRVARSSIDTAISGRCIAKSIAESRPSVDLCLSALSPSIPARVLELVKQTCSW